jgi:hypothetical protein
MCTSLIEGDTAMNHRKQPGHLRSCGLLVFCVLFIACSKAANGTQQNRDLGQANNAARSIAQNYPDSSDETTKQWDFSGHSSQGGMLTAKFHRSEIILIRIVLAGERGKEILSFDFKTPTSIVIVREIIEYENSIYNGDVKIKSSKIETMHLEGEKLYRDNDGNSVEISDPSITDLLSEAKGVINSK